MTIQTAEFTAALTKDGLITYQDQNSGKDVRLYTGYIIIQNRGRRYARRFDQLTSSTETRLRAIAKKLRPAENHKRRPAQANRKPRQYQSKRRPSAAEALRQSTYSATAQLVARANGEQPEPYFLPGHIIPREAFEGSDG